MKLYITSVRIGHEHDIVLARQRARTIAALLGFDVNDQTRVSTAVSEIARNVFQYAGGGEVSFAVDPDLHPRRFEILIRDSGPGIERLDDVLEGRYRSSTGMGLGIVGARRLMDHFRIESSSASGTSVTLGQDFPPDSRTVSPEDITSIVDQLIRQKPQDPLAEIQRQNQELLRAMALLEERKEELERLNRELADTNRGIVALYRELEEKAAHLNRSNSLKAQFLSNMTHEFRTPLNSILSLSRLLLDRLDGELTGEQEKQVLYIRKAAEDLSSLVNDLLDLAKIEAGKVSLQVTDCSLSEVMSSLRGMMRPLLRTDRVSLQVDDASHIPTLRTDSGKLSQILRNLLSNAIKFTEQGEIRVTATLDPAETHVTITVSDTGIGIPSEDLERIFEEYAQVDNPLQRKEKGTGLGLPLSRKLANLLGGSLTVESRLGEGSTFTLRIPLRCSVNPTEHARENRSDITRTQVLILEDDDATMLVYEKYLKGSGFQILPARSVLEARELLRHNRPCAMVVDILLKGENSWGFMQEVKHDPLTRDIPLIVVSVLDEHDKGIDLGAYDFMTKPVERKWLLDRLNAIALSTKLETVLIIDDEEVARYIVKGILADTRFRFLEASNGQDGIELARTARPDLILLDLMMPGMSGFEVLHQLKRDSRTCHIPVIIVTSQILTDEERAALNREAAAVLSKQNSSREHAVARVRETLEKVLHREMP